MRAAGWAAVALSIVCTAPSVRAQPAFPAKPIRWIIDFPAGGVSDFLARTVGERMAEGLGRPLVYDNRPGASGLIAYQLASKAAPDGYTVVLISTPFAFHLNLHDKPGFDTEKDFAPVALFAQFPNLLLVNAKSPVTNVREFLALAKAKPGALNYGSLGVGSPQHLAMESFRRLYGFSATHVPYTGSPQALTALIGGQTDAMFGNAPGSMPQIKAGKVRALAVAASARASALPDVPTFAEAGYPFEAVGFAGLAVPAGTPRPVVLRLNREAVASLGHPDVQERIRQFGGEPQPGTPEAFAKFIRAEIVRWASVIRESGARAEAN